MPENMVAVRKMQPAPGLELVETDVPKCGPSDVLIKVRACSLCGTDLHIYKWEPPWSTGRMQVPKTLGHELCGDIIEVGADVKNFEVGDFISAESHVACNNCDMCKTGNAHICRNLKFLGVDINGSFAEYMALPADNAWKNPKDMKPEIATLQESLGNSVYTVEESKVFGKSVAVFGTGPTGLFSIPVAKAMGASNVIVVVGTEFHTNIIKKLGADTIINRHESDVVKEILNATNNLGADVVLEMSGAVQAIEQSIEVVKPTGQVSVLGLPTKEVPLDISKKIVLKDITFRGIYGRKMWRTWETTSQLLKNGLDITPVITHKLPLEKFEEGIAAAMGGQAGKVVMFPNKA